MAPGISQARLILPCLLATVLCGSPASAGDPPGAAYPLVYQFGNPHIGVASDLAVYAPRDNAKSVFVVDRTPPHKVLRFASTGQSNSVTATFPLAPPISTTAGCTPYWDVGIAANDNPGSQNFGYFFVVEVTGASTPARLFVVNAETMVQKSLSSLEDSGLNDLTLTMDVANDAEGNLYVTDAVTRRVHKFAALDVFNATGTTGTLTAVADFALMADAGAAVSVDHNHRVHVVGTGIRQGLKHYTILSPNGTIVATPPIGALWPMAVCALNPCADGLIPVRSSTAYEINRFNLDWPACSLLDTALTFGAGDIARPEYAEYQKFNRSLGAPSLPGWAQQQCDERLFSSLVSKVSVFGQSYLSVQIPAGHIGWWRFEETQDSVTPAAVTMGDYFGVNDAFPDATIPQTVEGMVRCAFDTRGGTAYGRVLDAPSMDIGNGSMTIEGWIRTEQNNGTVTVLDNRNGTGAGYSVFIYNGRLGFQTNLGGSPLVYQNYAPGTDLTPGVFAPHRVADGRWRHFAVVLDRTVGNQLTIYIDGQAVGTPATPLAGSISNAADIYFGRVNPAASGTPLVGALDELTIYNVPLTPAQIVALFNARSAGKHLWETPPI